MEANFGEPVLSHLIEVGSLVSATLCSPSWLESLPVMLLSPFHSTGAGIADVHHHAQLFVWEKGIEFGSSGSCDVLLPTEPPC